MGVVIDTAGPIVLALMAPKPFLPYDTMTAGILFANVDVQALVVQTFKPPAVFKLNRVTGSANAGDT